MIEPNSIRISIHRQCNLVGLGRSSFYYEAAPETAENLKYMRMIDKQYTKTPFYGSRRMGVWLTHEGYEVNRKRVQRLMRLMGLEAIYQKPKLSQPGKGHKKYPYLLRNIEILRPNHVWSTDITYVPMDHGFMYLVAIIDWYSRYVLTWRLSNTLDGGFCEEALDEAIQGRKPDIFNTDQGVQFTSQSFTSRLEAAQIQVSMDGRGRALDNIFVERLWRTLKYEDIYLKNYQNGLDLHQGMKKYFQFYNTERPHQSLGYKTPEYIYRGGLN